LSSAASAAKYQQAQGRGKTGLAEGARRRLVPARRRGPACKQSREGAGCRLDHSQKTSDKVAEPSGEASLGQREKNKIDKLTGSRSGARLFV
jgi:hypothetical protein